MTPQEVLDTVYERISDQGRQSTTATGACRYRGVDNTACAVGCLLDDDTAREWDKRQWKGLHAIWDHYGIPGWMEPSYALLASLQNAHDSYYRGDDGDFRDYWDRKIKDIADLYDLESPVPEYEDL